MMILLVKPLLNILNLLMKEIGKIINLKDMENKFIMIIHIIKAILRMEKSMGKVHLHGLVKFIKVILLMDIWMGKGH